MRNLAAIFLFGVGLVALCGSFGGTRHSAGQVQFAPQVVTVANSLTDGPYIPVTNDRNHPLYAVAVTDTPNFAYRVIAYSPPVITGTQGAPPAVDYNKLPADFEGFLNTHADWEPTNVPNTFVPGANILVFRHRR